MDLRDEKHLWINSRGIQNLCKNIVDKCQNIVNFHCETRHLITYFARNLCKKSPML
jgi:hypothetical protein